VDAPAKDRERARAGGLHDAADRAKPWCLVARAAHVLPRRRLIAPAVVLEVYSGVEKVCAAQGSGQPAVSAEKLLRRVALAPAVARAAVLPCAAETAAP